MTEEEQRNEEYYQIIRNGIDEIEWEDFDCSWLNESMLRELRNYITVTNMVKYGNELSMDFIRELLPHLSLYDMRIIQDRVRGSSNNKKTLRYIDEIVCEYIKRLKEAKNKND